MNLFTMDYYTDFRDVDRYFDIRADSMMQVLGTISSHHEVRGFKFQPDYMKQRGMAWILYQWKIKILKPKQYARRLTFKTLPVVEKDVYCYRYYEIRDIEGEVVGYALAHWVAIDLDKRKITRIPEDLKALIQGDGIPTPEQKRIIDGSNKKPVRKRDTTFDFEIEIPLRYSDVDSNLHVNNAIYGGWATETIHQFDPEFLLKYYHEEIRVVYKKEKLPGGFVKSKLSLDGDTSYHEIYDEADNLLTLIEMKWVPKTASNGDYSEYRIDDMA